MESARFASGQFLIHQAKKAGVWPASADCSSAISRLTLVRRAVPWFKAQWAFQMYARRRHFELRLACACRAQLAVRAADPMLGLVTVVPVLLLLRYELRCTAKSILSRATYTNLLSYKFDIINVDRFITEL
jgi:hypothetical protein